MFDDPRRIPLDQCKDRRLYRLNSRNLSFGVFNKSDNGFIGLRTKFGSIYAFTEYHWDTGEPFGTANPLEELPETLPEDILLEDAMPGAWCSNCDKQVEFRKENEPGERWVHLENTTCKEALACGKLNIALETWLHKMEEKYK